MVAVVAAPNLKRAVHVSGPFLGAVDLLQTVVGKTANLIRVRLVALSRLAHLVGHVEPLLLLHAKALDQPVEDRAAVLGSCKLRLQCTVLLVLVEMPLERDRDDSAALEDGHVIDDGQVVGVDVEKRKKVLSIGTGGLSGPCVKPVALRMVYQVAKAVKIPVVGLGGISSAKDALEFLMAGATAIEIGTANFLDPAVTIKVRDGINEWLDAHGCQDIHEIIGCL